MGERTVGWEAYSPTLAVEWIASGDRQRHRVVDGGLLFLDISGFTALSEMLAALGRVGAEEITDVIDDTFERLLEPAYAQGGSMLKFGGDALLLLFEGAGGGLRAAHAAHHMMDVIQEENPVRTRAGDVELGMTVGVAEGPVHLVLTEGARRELIVAGPTVSQALQLEKAATTGQVLLGTALAGAVPASSLDGSHGSGVLLTGPVIDQPSRSVPLSKPDHPQARRLMDPAVADHLESGGMDGEHRFVHLGFLRFSGTDALFAEDPDRGADAVQALMDVVVEACQQTEVAVLASDVDVDGGKLILTAGAPKTRGDDADRLLWAARRILDAKPPLTPRIGVASGPVFAGPVGPPYRRTYTVLGDAVNLAARVMAQCGPGELRSTAAPLNAARTLFEMVAEDEFVPRGKSLPVRTVTIGPERGIRLRLRPDQHLFVGRQAELAQLSQSIAGPDGGPGVMSVLIGPAGSGKSRLIDELQHHNPAVPYFLAACQETAAQRSFYAAGQCLRAVLGRDRRASAQLVIAAARGILTASPDHDVAELPLLGSLLDLDLPDTPVTERLAPQHRRDRTAHLVADLLALANPGPAVLVIEDGQWGDPESRMMLQAIVDQLDRLPWLVLITARDRDTLPRLARPSEVRADVIELGPLSEEESRSLLMQDVEAGRIGMDRVDSLLSRGGGNPLFLLELSQAIAEGAEVSDGIEQVLRSRLDLLSGRDRRVLGQAAVLGVEFLPELLATVAGPEASSTAQIARLKDFLRPMRSGALRFNQTLYQEVAYASIPFKNREQMHAKAARAIEASMPDHGDVAALLSRHWYLAGDMAQAWVYSRRAAALAAERHAPSTAAMLYRRALDAAAHADASREDRFDLRIALGDNLLLAGSYAEAAESYQQALLVAQPDGAGAVHLQLAKVRERQGEYAAALDTLEAAQRSGAVDAEVTQVERAIVLNRMGRHDEAILAADLGLDAADPQVRGRARYAKAWALNSQGVDGGELARSAASLLEGIGDLNEAAKARTTLGWALYRGGEWSASVKENEIGAAHFLQIGDRVNAAVAEMNIAEIRSDQGRLEEARAWLTRARQVLAAAGHEAAVAFADMLAGRLAARSGAGEEAERVLLAVLSRYEALEVEAMVVSVREHLAEAAVFADRATEAREMLAGLPSAVDPKNTAFQLRLEGVAAWATGDTAAAVGLLAESVAVAAGGAAPYELLLSRTALEALGGSSTEVGSPADGLDVVDPLVLAVGPLLAARLAPRR